MTAKKNTIDDINALNPPPSAMGSIRCPHCGQPIVVAQFAAGLGRLGGSVTSEAKTVAARLNRAKGAHKAGRPKGAKDTKPRKKKAQHG